MLKTEPSACKLLEQRNKYTNIIGQNPNESDEEKTVYLSLKEFAKLHGFRFRTKKFKEILQEAKVDGKQVFTFIDDGRNKAKETLILVNPNVVEPFQKESSDLLKSFFE